jgi:chromosome segregation ATPase
MTKQDLQKELQEKVKEGVKPSDLKKLKRSKSADDIPTSLPPKPPLKKSQSQLELPLPNQPSKDQIIKQLKQDLLFTQNTANNYLTSLSAAQAQITQLQEQIKENPAELKTKITQLEDQILQLRLDKIKEFSEYYETKQDLESELDQNISLAVKEIVKLKDQLKELNKKKLTLQQKLGQASSKNAQLELKLIAELSNENGFNY